MSMFSTFDISFFTFSVLLYVHFVLEKGFGRKKYVNYRLSHKVSKIVYYIVTGIIPFALYFNIIHGFFIGYYMTNIIWSLGRYHKYMLTPTVIYIYDIYMIYQICYYDIFVNYAILWHILNLPYFNNTIARFVCIVLVFIDLLRNYSTTYDGLLMGSILIGLLFKMFRLGLKDKLIY